jgi:hypothetical protein
MLTLAASSWTRRLSRWAHHVGEVKLDRAELVGQRGRPIADHSFVGLHLDLSPIS